MSHKIESYYCPDCRTDTPHVVVLVRKTSAFKNDTQRSRKEFVAGFIKSVVFGAFLAAMDEFSRHLVCERCGHKVIEE